MHSNGPQVQVLQSLLDCETRQPKYKSYRRVYVRYNAHLIDLFRIAQPFCGEAMYHLSAPEVELRFSRCSYGRVFHFIICKLNETLHLRHLTWLPRVFSEKLRGWHENHRAFQIEASTPWERPGAGFGVTKPLIEMQHQLNGKKGSEIGSWGNHLLDKGHKLCSGWAEMYTKM